MKVLFVTGDRNWSDIGLIEGVFADVQPDLLIEGGARGADGLSRIVAEDLGIEVEEHLANWSHYGKAAGPIRNGEMCNRLMDLRAAGHEIVCRAFHENLAQSKGTKNMVALLDAGGFDYEVIS